MPESKPPQEPTPMPPSKHRFESVVPSAKVTRAIVSRGRGRFAIVRPDVAPSAIISRVTIEQCGEVPRLRLGGIPVDTDAGGQFEAGMQFGKAC